MNSEIKLINGDCLDVMKTMADNCIDITVTSPPYDNLRTYNGNIDQWSFDKFQEIAKELYRLTKYGGVVVLVVSDSTINGSETGTSFRQALWFMECGFNLHDTMIWNKGVLTFPCLTRYHNCFEYMFVFSKGKPKIANLIQDRENKHGGELVHGRDRLKDGTTKKQSGYGKRNIKKFGARFNIWNLIPVQSSKERTGHPAQFPEQLANDHIISWSNIGDTVFDPFMGSGTTGKMALLNNRNFIGIEIDEQYFEISKERIQSCLNDINNIGGQNELSKTL